MKELIVVIGMIVLGCMIFDMIAGDGQSLKAACTDEIDRMISIYEDM